MVRLGQSPLFRTPGSVFSLFGKECCEQAPRSQCSSGNLQKMLFFYSPESIFLEKKKGFCSKATVTDFTQVFWEFYFFAFAPFFWCAVSTSTAAWKSTSAWLPCPNLFFFFSSKESHNLENPFKTQHTHRNRLREKLFTRKSRVKAACAP